MADSIVARKIDFIAGVETSLVIHLLQGEACWLTCQTECPDKQRLSERLKEILREGDDDEF